MQLNKLKKVVVHVLIWLVLIFLNFVVIRNYRIDYDLVFNLLTWILFIGIFYINFILLMPLFFQRKFLLYFSLSIAILALFSVLKIKLDQDHFEQRIENMPAFKPGKHPGAYNYADSLDTRRKKPPEFNPGPNKPFPSERGKFMLRLPPFSFYSLILIWFASISVSLFQKWQADEKRKSEIEKEQISNELSFLKQQVNPHFLFNALNNIYSLTINTSQQASSAILKLSSILRYMLYETENKWVNLYEELQIIDDYIELQKLRLIDQGSLDYSVSGDPANKKIAPLLLIPLVENAFKHGVDNINRGHIKIKLDIGIATLDAYIENRILEKQSVMKTASGIGIRNIKRRLDLLYPGRHSLEIREEDNNYKVHLIIQLGLYNSVK